uniref:HLH transcriptional factor n=1 Tax=Penicillium digitatum TaxID=36651 RepID=A0A088MWZ0_PENDI|nr:HLH transcriptional factor [Penicillium digitatum]
MSGPNMENDFQLLSSGNSGGDEAQGNGHLFTPPSGEIVNQDWTQWMRWDEPMFSEGDQKPMGSSTDLPSISPYTDMSSPSHLNFKDSSPNLPVGLMEIQSEPNAENNLGYTHTQLGQNSHTSQQQNLGLVSPISSVGISRKRKTSSDDDATIMTEPVQPGKKMPAKKRAHNVIEKRYRANLNDKIAELRDSVPSLRLNKNPNGGSADDDEETEGANAANKLNKASILSKATEYIKHLEIRNQRLEDENTDLKNRLRQADKLADQAATSSASVSSPSNYASTESGSGTSPSVFSQAEDVSSESSPTSQNPPEGLLPVPDAWKRMRAETANHGVFAESFMKYPSLSSSPHQPHFAREDTSTRRSRMPNKYMLGALAGLMVLEGMGSDDSESESKGLFALPMGLFGRFHAPTLAHWEFYLIQFWYSWQARAFSRFLMLATLVVGSAFIVFVYLFNAQPISRRGPSKSAFESPAAPPTPSDFRRRAWLTSMQRVGVPRHRFFREWYVVTSRCFEYVLRCLLGWKFYSWATGITEEDEKGRLKTWDIAIDAQLTGGDSEISKSRLVLTIFAAGTLPCTPIRMITKALHVRILLWNVGEAGSWSFHVSNDIARALARFQWDVAREINAALPDGHPDQLPPHLAALIKLECDDVMIDSIIQRAVNLTWNRPTQEGTGDDEVLLDVVDEDPAIQCSQDALAAWWSSHLLQTALLKYFEASEKGPVSKTSRDAFKEKIRMSLDVAPVLSAAYTRALVMKAVFFEHNRIENVGVVLAALPKEKRKGSQSHSSNFLDSSLPVSVRDEISIAVRCAMIATIITERSTGDASSLPESFTIQKAITWFNQLPIGPVELSLIGFSSVYHLLHLLASDVDYIASSDSSDSSSPSAPASEATSSADDEAEEKPRPTHKPFIWPRDIPNIGRVSAELIYWARNAYTPAFYGFSSTLIEVIVNSCTSICQDAGINVTDFVHTPPYRALPKKYRTRRRVGESQSSQSDADQDLVIRPVPRPPLRRGRSASNDTGYGSLSIEEDEQPVPRAPTNVQNVPA